MDIVDTILHGDALQTLRTLPGGCVQCCVTSPPYFGLRDYGVPGQLGLERTPDEYVARMVEVFREVRRVLRSDGTCWLNLGDSYYAHNGTRGNVSNAAPDNKWPNAITHIHKAAQTQRYRLRRDLTPEQQAYVLAELAKARAISADTQEGR